jgi:hypothetical protein
MRAGWARIEVPAGRVAATTAVLTDAGNCGCR